MARKKKINLTPEEELEQVLSETDQTKDTLKALEKTRKELEAKVKMDRLAALDELINESGKSYDEVEELLRN